MNKRGTSNARHTGAVFTLAVLAVTVFLSKAGADTRGQELAVHTIRQETVDLPQTPPVVSAAPVQREAPEPEAWNLRLVNPWTYLPEDYELTLTQLKNGHSVDTRCYPELQAMMDACRAAGLSPVICSSYRTQEKQERLYHAQVDRLIARGYGREEAETEAGRSVAVPGTSEHQLGLAVDIVDLSNQNLNESQEDTAVQKWLMENSWRYGFILRYPNDKSDVTGIVYEPWHYRYVGKEAAKEIYGQGICLEEYLERINTPEES